MRRRFTDFFNVTFVVTLICALSAKAQPTDRSLSRSLLTQEQSEKQVSVPDDPGLQVDRKLIPDFGEVTPMLYRGDNRRNTDLRRWRRWVFRS